MTEPSTRHHSSCAGGDRFGVVLVVVVIDVDVLFGDLFADAAVVEAGDGVAGVFHPVAEVVEPIGEAGRG